MIASGTLALSLARKEIGVAEILSRKTMLSYANRAINAQSVRNGPILETVLTAWTFWQLDMMCGDFKAAMMHMGSAIKIVQNSQPNHFSDAFAAWFIQGIMSGISSPLKRETGGWDPINEEDPADVRKRKTMASLMQGYPQLVTCCRRLVASDAPEKTNILAILDEAKQEVQWILKKWLPLDEYVLWRAEAEDVDNACIVGPDDLQRPGLFSKIVQDVDEYLAGSVAFSLNDWEVSVSRTTLMLILTTVRSDLLLRHDMLEFCEIAKQIRAPRKPTLGSLPSLPFYCELFSQPQIQCIGCV